MQEYSVNSVEGKQLLKQLVKSYYNIGGSRRRRRNLGSLKNPLKKLLMELYYPEHLVVEDNAARTARLDEEYRQKCCEHIPPSEKNKCKEHSDFTTSKGNHKAEHRYHNCLSNQVKKGRWIRKRNKKSNIKRKKSIKKEEERLENIDKDYEKLMEFHEENPRIFSLGLKQDDPKLYKNLIQSQPPVFPGLHKV